MGYLWFHATAATVMVFIAIGNSSPLGRHTIDDMTEEECALRYADYLNHFTMGETKMVCFLMRHVKVEQSVTGGRGRRPSLPVQNASGLPSEDELRDQIHVDTDEDMRHRREELQRAEKQERLLRMRDRDNAIVAEVLRGIIMHKQPNADAMDADAVIVDPDPAEDESDAEPSGVDHRHRGAIYTDPNRILQG